MLVTHGLSFLSKADLVLVMEQGQISEMGSYMELMDRKGAFAKSIHTFNGNQHRESSTLRDRSKKSNLTVKKLNKNQINQNTVTKLTRAQQNQIIYTIIVCLQSPGSQCLVSV